MDSLELIGQATESVVPQLTVDEETEKFARLIAEPLESGYGITLGNALRRVLLSSLEGAAITSVRVEQVQHEFSTILGLQEDTTEFLLNAKEIRIRALSNRSGTLALDIEGPCKVTAGDLQVPADFEIVNPELHLATIDVPKARLNVEFHAELGKGYVPAGSVEGLPIGVIPVDAIFTPVRKVNYRVEKTRVGQSTNYDRLDPRSLDRWHHRPDRRRWPERRHPDGPVRALQPDGPPRRARCTMADRFPLARLLPVACSWRPTATTRQSKTSPSPCAPTTASSAAGS